jgi:hypothetical protein
MKNLKNLIFLTLVLYNINIFSYSFQKLKENTQPAEVLALLKTVDQPTAAIILREFTNTKAFNTDHLNQFLKYYYSKWQPKPPNPFLELISITGDPTKTAKLEKDIKDAEAKAKDFETKFNAAQKLNEQYTEEIAELKIKIDGQTRIIKKQGEIIKGCQDKRQEVETKIGLYELELNQFIEKLKVIIPGVTKNDCFDKAIEKLRKCK